MDEKQNFLRIILIIIHIILILCTLLCIYIAINNSIPHIKIEDYQENIDYGVLSEYQKDIFNNILNAIDEQKSFIECGKLSEEEKHEIITHLGMYLGVIFHRAELLRFNENGVFWDLELLNSLLEQKIIIDARIDEAISTIKEGSDKYKLWQISNYISQKIAYNNEFRDIIKALNGDGVCEAYAMIFYKMASRIGIQTYICYGYATEDGYHAWNMVKLNEETLYYDITWYDKLIPDVKYIKSSTSWDRNFRANNLWSSDFGYKTSQNN